MTCIKAEQLSPRLFYSAVWPSSFFLVLFRLFFSISCKSKTRVETGQAQSLACAHHRLRAIEHAKFGPLAKRVLSRVNTHFSVLQVIL